MPVWFGFKADTAILLMLDCAHKRYLEFLGIENGTIYYIAGQYVGNDIEKFGLLVDQKETTT